MATPDDLDAIIERISNGSPDEKDINLLKQFSIGSQHQLQAKYITYVNSVEKLYIGDTINQSFDEEYLQRILNTLQKIDRETLQRILNIVQKIDHQTSPQTTNDKFIATNNLQTQLVSVAPPPIITTFEFEVVTVDHQGREKKRFLKQAEYFIENLENDIFFEMVSLPDGKFQMGVAKDEEVSQEEERPQRIVNIKSFFLSKYPITQAQWKAVANLPKIKRHLDIEPSCFRGNNLPVERVSWHDAQEFCQRLSQKTGRNYRLPSEAEWEYACRAQTSTPFHFGKTITTHLASYNKENKDFNGVYQQQTTEVGSFPANNFGLFDMHGNVWEWCADYDHEDYYGAPSDGSAWLDDGNEEYRILRGGSWNSSANLCRSASRFSGNGSVTIKEYGFRVACS